MRRHNTTDINSIENTEISFQKSPDKSPKRVSEMFDAVASRYDFLNHLLSVGIDSLWRRCLVKNVLRFISLRSYQQAVSAGSSICQPMEILDVATGTADLPLTFARAFQRIARKNVQPVATVGHITGVDFSPEMLHYGQRKVDVSGMAELITLQQGDALQLPFENNRFDAVTVAFGIRNMADTDRALEEMIRVLLPGGRVAILEFSMPTAPVISTLYRFYFKRILPKVGSFFSKKSGSSYTYLPASVLHFDTPAQMTARMARLGLKEIQAIPLTFGIATLYLGQK